MSVRVSSLVWERSGQSGDSLLLLLAMADFCDEDGICWPSQERLAERVRCSDRWIRALLKRLVLATDIAVIEQGGGRSKSTSYQLNNLYVNQEHKSRINDETRNSKSRITVPEKEELSDTNPEHSSINVEHCVPRNHHRTVREPSNEPSANLPLPFDSPDFSEAWELWKNHRREIRKKLTPTAIGQQFDLCKKVGKADAIEMIQNSVRNGWTGLFPPKVQESAMGGTDDGIYRPIPRRDSNGEIIPGQFQ